jgi:hypothetical protein
MIPADQALRRFVESTDALLALIDSVGERWSERVPGEEWTRAQIVEHVVQTNRATLTRLRGLDQATPMAGVPRFPDERIDERMFQGVPAPPGLPEPTGRFATGADGAAALRAVRDDVVACVRTEAGRLRDVGFTHPAFGTFDGVQWVLFLAAHTGNHVPALRPGS